MRLVVFLHGSRYDRLYQAVNLIVTAAAMGWKCHLFLFFGALASFMSGSWDDVNVSAAGEGDRPDVKRSGPSAEDPCGAEELQRGFERANIPSLYGLLEKARRESGGVTVCACSTSVRLLNLDPASVKARVDEIVGLSTMLQIASEAEHAIYI
ncbi:MAG: hypothetical protein GTO51_10310 [Candidatus Latescibacteria bacterium]|nr:hypothetical protein [Candidatus Latescibacterota bacterium]NIM66360.1 hypothetical protein [Candidatus Latescibacterota bacterium]NIO02839.1 hypothetical protein [Candidatus Latescibacterota bacterium]NIO29974.1 hypothetical protein [Candidatus Latescibacterota bacterium]NIO57589.1 hypothetical protein [Candidatus Latescibacterota bacterium]